MKICITCSTEFKPSSRHKSCPSCRALALRLPCPKCKKLMRPKSDNCKNCYTQKGSSNGNWRGGSTIHQKGYVRIKVASGKYRMEHALVMEEILGRPLLPNENVHHLNGVRNDNRPENLELWIRPQPTGIRVQDAVAWAKLILERYDSFN